MPSIPYLMLRSARRARLEARTALMQPLPAISGNFFTSSGREQGSEFDAEFADQDLLSTVDVGNHQALAPMVFEAGVDEYGRAPDQVRVDRRELLVCRQRLQGADELGRHGVIIIAGRPR